MKKINKYLIWGVIILVVVSFLVYFSRKPAEAINIGVISGLSGKYAVAGENFAHGIQLAHEQYLERNPNKKVEIIVEDDAFEEKRGVLAYSKLKEFNDIDALINLTSPTIDAIYSSVTKDGIPVIQFGVQSRPASPDNIYQISPSADEPLIAFGAKVKELSGSAKVAFVYENIPAVLTFADDFEKGFSDNGSLSKFKLDPTDKDIRTVALKIVDSKPKVVAFITTPELGALLVKEIVKLSGDNKPMFAFDSQLQAGFSDYERILGDMNVLNGSLVLVVKNEINENFVADYKARFGGEPGFGADWGYDAFNILIDAYNKNVETWKENIENTNVSGVTGQITFDVNGARKAQKDFTTIESGKLKGI